MRLLLDSNVLLWSLLDRRRLTPRVLDLLQEDRNDLFVSRASLWELSIKVAKGKLTLPGSSIHSLLEQIRRIDIIVLPIEDAHILRAENLPLHHRDPFDRMLVAQALVEGLPILSSDQSLTLYDAEVIWR